MRLKMKANQSLAIDKSRNSKKYQFFHRLDKESNINNSQK